MRRLRDACRDRVPAQEFLIAGQLLIVFDTSSQDTVPFRKYDSFAMWQASAAWCPNTTSSTTGLRVRTASKYVARCGRRSSQSGPLNAIVSGIGTWPSAGSLSWCHLATYASRSAFG